MRYVKRSEINTEKWDACVSHSTKPLIYGLSWYLNAVTDNQWDGLVWGEYEAVMPLPWNQKLMKKQVYKPRHLQQMGPFFSKDVSLEQIEETLNQLFFQYHISTSVPISKNQRKTVNQILHLRTKEETISRFSKTRKYDARKLDTTIQQISEDEFIQSFNVFAKELIQETNLDVGRVRRMISSCIENNAGQLLAAYVDDKIESIIFLSEFKNRITLLLSASSKKGFKARANVSLLLNQILSESNQGYILDFEGSELPGIHDYFASFGATEEYYYQLFKENKLLSQIKNIVKR